MKTPDKTDDTTILTQLGVLKLNTANTASRLSYGDLKNGESVPRLG